MSVALSASARFRHAAAIALGVCTALLFVAGAQAAELQYPLAIAAADGGPIFLGDKDFHGIWKISDNSKLEVYFEGSKKFKTPLTAVRCVAVDGKGRLVAGDSSTREIFRFNEGNKPEPLTKGKDGIGRVGIPMSIAFDAKGDILVADLEIHRIVKVPEAGGEPAKFADVTAPRGLAMDAQGRLWVVSGGKDQVLRILPDGKVETVVAGRPFKFPHNLVFDTEQTAYVSDGYGKAIWKIDAAGKPVKWVEGMPLVNPVGIAWQGDRLLIVDPHAKAVFEVSKEGKLSALKLMPAGE